MFEKLKNALAGNSDNNKPVFTQHKYRPSCSVKLVGGNVLLLMGFNDGTSNGYCTRLDLPVTHFQIAEHIFDALSHSEDPLREGGAGDPPYYVVAAGMNDLKKFHKSSSEVGVQWVKKPHTTESMGKPLVQDRNYWAPGVYLSPMKRLRRTGSAEGLGDAYNRGPIPPEDHGRIGREVMELFDIIRTEFDGEPLPLRLSEDLA